MSVLSAGMVGASGVDVGDITKSLRFRASGSTYMSKTLATPTSTTIWTLSLWVKRGAITGTYRLFGASTTTYLTFNSSDQLNLTLNGASACTSTAVFRDPTSWLHVVYQQNGSAQTIWVNNLSVATGTTAASIFNTAIAHQIGAANTSNYLDGYLSRICFVDGTALTPSSFGQLNTEINEWVTKSRSACKAVVDAGGTNSFMLEFEDGTSLTTLGYDLASNNYLIQSQFASGWTPGAVATGTANFATAPDATTTAYKLTENSATSSALYRTVSTATAALATGTLYTLSTYAKKNDLRYVYLTATGPFSSTPVAHFDFDTGVCNSTSNTTATSITSVGSGWFRVSMTALTTSGAAATLIIGATSADGSQTHTGVVGYYTLLWGAQINRGSALDPYVPNTTTASPPNDWTLTNHSITAGVTYDWMEDRPGNSYAVLNPLVYNGASIVSGNTQLTTSATQNVRGSFDLRSCGKCYYEYPSAGVNYTGWGVASELATLNFAMGNNNANLWGYYNTTTMWFDNNTASSNSGIAPPASGGVCCVAFDAATGKAWFGYAASGSSTPTWLSGGDPAAGTTPSATISLTNGLFPHGDIIGGGGSQTLTFNAGQYPATANSAYRSAAGGFFHCVPPTGFLALCQQNLPEGAVRNPKKHFDVDTYTGTGSALNRTGFQLRPDFVWVKGRSGATNHNLSDSVRGTSATLFSNTTGAENAGGQRINAFNSDGFSVGTDTDVNTNTATYAAWLWKANGAAVTNLYTYSQDFSNAAWNQQSITPTYSQSAPDGSSTATLFLAGSGDNKLWRVSPPTTVNSTNTVSMYFKAGTSSTASISIGNSAFNNSISCTFNLSSGVAGTPSYVGTPSGGVASMTSVGGGWYRCSLSGVIDNSTTSQIFYAYFSVPNTQSLYMWGAQAQSGSTATPYIPNAAIIATVSANQTAGFSIVTYTGTGANATVGHGLGVAPKLVIVKCRSNANDWPAYHASNTAAPETDYLLLNSTAATADDNTYWNDTAPTTTVFSIGTNTDVNTNTYTYVAYCFAEIAGFSKIGSYTGNGSTDGVFVHCGFRPAMILTKCSSTTGDWRIYDDLRPGYNVQGGTLLANTSGAETTTAEIDIVSNGFKARITTDPNSAQTFVFLAIADVNGKYSNAR